MSKSKSVLVVSCTHVGHKGGLCGPDNWQSMETDDPKLLAIGTIHRQVYGWWKQEILPLRPDVVIHSGDIIDGPQGKSDGRDLWSTDQGEQAESAVRLLKPLVRNAKFFVVEGSEYHDPEGREAQIARELGAECCTPHAFVDINGVMFDCKHKITGGNVPSSRPAMRTAMLQNLLWCRKGGQPLADIIVRGHMHEYYFEGDSQYTGIVVPGMQWFSKFGQLNVQRTISVGCVFFPCVESGMEARDVAWVPLIAELPALAPRVFKA